MRKEFTAKTPRRKDNLAVIPAKAVIYLIAMFYVILNEVKNPSLIN